MSCTGSKAKRCYSLEKALSSHPSLSCGKNNFPSGHRCISNRWGMGVYPPFRKPLDFSQPPSSTTCPMVPQRGHKPEHQQACTKVVPLQPVPDSLCESPTFTVHLHCRWAHLYLGLFFAPYGDPCRPRERQPASCWLGQGVTESCFQHKWHFCTSQDAMQCFCKGNRNSPGHRTLSSVTSCVTHTGVYRKAHEQGVLPGSGAAPVLPAHPSQKGHWKGQDWLS